MSVTLKKFAISGDNVFPFKQTEGSIVDRIPAGLYSIEFSPMFGYFLQKKSDNIELPPKIYGSTIPRSERTFSVYDRTAEPLTIGLFGSKGAGKTLLANVLAQKGIDRGMPVIDVSSSFTIDKEYLAFIESLGSVVVLFDEFLKKLSGLDIPLSEERTHNAKHDRANTAQDNLLTFLQGTGNAKRLTILIDNNANMLSEYIKERPGRMRYRYNYEAIEPAVVTAVGQDAGLTAGQIEELVLYTQLTQTTFDVMRVIIQEWTFFPGVPLSDITDVLNVPTVRSYAPETFKITVLEKGKHSDVNTEQKLTGTGAGRSSIQVELLVTNPFVHDEIVDKEGYYDNDDLCTVFKSWTDYQQNRLSPVIKRNIYLNHTNMIGYSETHRKYRLECGTVLEAESNNDRAIIDGDGYNHNKFAF